MHDKISLKRTRLIKVLNKKKVTPNMLRITFTHEDLFDFPNNEKGGYVKLLFKDKSTNTELVRPYTIRDFRKKRLELDIDFAIHSKDSGYASNWAAEAKVGDQIYISGPGAKNLVDLNSNWFFLVGDMSALPAISVNIEELDENSTGFAIIEIPTKEDKQEIIKPENFTIDWLVNSDLKKSSERLLEKVKLVKWLTDNPFVWVACEFNTMKVLRNFFQNEKKIKKKNM
ncbi:siderophore-interacting protein, partial [Rickettsiales bacterium]|nr:siderophore-interacting protein [Rickettsiales bacterium]